MILIRADANPYIGMGHIVRCLSLADAFRFCNQEVCFLLADEGVAEFVSNRGYKVFVLNTSYDSMDEELSRWPSVFAEAIIIDSYYVTDSYLRNLKDKATLVYIDDRASYPYPVDVLVNYNIYGEYLDYRELYKNAQRNPLFLLGPQYALLRTMFQKIPKREQKKEVRNIMVSTGGSDPCHIALRLVKACSEKYIYHVVLGMMNQDKKEIYRVVHNSDNIMIHENISDMKSFICSCDLAISAAGSTLYELCACGVPFVTFTTADNQIPGAEGFERKGLTINCGDMRKGADGVRRLLDGAEVLAQDYTLRVHIGKEMQRMIDGEGSARLAGKVLSVG